MTTEMTTVKMRRATRIRLSDAARANHSTIDEYVTRLLDEALWRDRMERARACMSAAKDDYAQEVELWDEASPDGLR